MFRKDFTFRYTASIIWTIAACRRTLPLYRYSCISVIEIQKLYPTLLMFQQLRLISRLFQEFSTPLSLFFAGFSKKMHSLQWERVEDRPFYSSWNRDLITLLNRHLFQWNFHLCIPTTRVPDYVVSRVTAWSCIIYRDYNELWLLYTLILRVFQNFGSMVTWSCNNTDNAL